MTATPPPTTTAPPDDDTSTSDDYNSAQSPPASGAPPPASGALPPASGAPPTAPGDGPDKDSTLDQYEEIIKRELESGVILYNPADHMRVGVLNHVEVRISRKISDELDKGLQGKGDPRVEQLRVGTSMMAKLEGGAFDIKLVGSDVQYLGSAGFREWRWDVTPTASGTRSLNFTVSVLHDKYPNPIWEQTFHRQIDVVVNPGYSLSKWLSNNWEKLIAALVTIIGIIEGCRRLRLRRTDDRSAV